jgi:hypothetical protein
MKYYYIRRQSQGCDYTIGCGISVKEIRAKSKEEAIEKIIGLPDDWKEWDDDSLHDNLCSSGLADVAEDAWERKICSAELIEVNNSIDLMPILKFKLKEIQDFRSERKKKAAEDEEKLQYEKLKKKFEKK